MAKYYDLDDAEARLSDLRPLLAELRDDRDRVAEAQRRIQAHQGMDGDESDVTREQAGLTDVVRRMERAVRRMDAWGITLRDVGSGLVDFPALVNGRPIWLCWRLGEDHITFWHELDAGIAGRRPLIDLE